MFLCLDIAVIKITSIISSNDFHHFLTIETHLRNGMVYCIGYDCSLRLQYLIVFLISL